MEVKGKKVLVLYLTDWQIRMIKDVLGVDCTYWTVRVGESNVKYGVGLPINPKVKRMYLTDWQRREIEAEAHQSCEYIELEPRVIPLYGIPPEKL